MKLSKKILSIVLAATLVVGNMVTGFADVITKSDDISFKNPVADIVADEDDKDIRLDLSCNLSDKVKDYDDYYVSISAKTTDGKVADIYKENGKYYLEIGRAGTATVTITAKAMVADSGWDAFWGNYDRIASTTQTFTVTVEEVFEHIDLDMQGKYVADKQINGVSVEGYPQSYDVNVIKATGKINGGEVFTLGKNNVSDDDEEYRVYKNVSMRDELELTIEYQIGKSVEEEVIVGYRKGKPVYDKITKFVPADDEVYTYVHTYTRDELKKANEYCESGEGLDFVLDYEDISNELRNTVTVKYVVAGTEKKVAEDTVFTSAPGDTQNLTVPVITEITNGIEPGYYTVASTDVTISDKGEFTITVGEEDTVVVISYMPVEKEYYTVTYLDENGKVIPELSKVVEKGTKLDLAEKLAKDSVVTGNGIDDGADANIQRFAFSKWVPQGDYTADDLASVQQNMVFKAKYNAWNVSVKYYVLNRNLEQPSEIQSYSKENYSKGLAGKLDAFVEIKDEDEVNNYLGTIIPTAADFNSEYGLGVDTEKEYIKWYVIKEESDGWHVDGIITAKPQLVVKYVDEENKEIKAADITVVEPKATGTVAAADIEGYTLLDGQDLSYTAGMTGKTVVTIKYSENETTTEEITTEEATTEEPTTEEATTEEPTTEEATTEEPTTEEATTEEPTTEEATTEEPTTEEPTTEEATTEEATTEEPTTEEPDTDDVVIPDEDLPLDKGDDNDNTDDSIVVPDEDLPLDDGDTEDTTEDAIKEDDVIKNDDEQDVVIDDDELPLDGGTPKTGDSASKMGYTAALFAAAIAAVVAVFERKKAK